VNTHGWFYSITLKVSGILTILQSKIEIYQTKHFVVIVPRLRDGFLLSYSLQAKNSYSLRYRSNNF